MGSYLVLFIDAVVVKGRDGQVWNKPFSVVIGVTTSGRRDILGIWAGDGGERAKYWLEVARGLLAWARTFLIDGVLAMTVVFDPRDGR